MEKENKWISVKDRLPEDLEELVIKPIDEFDPEKTVKVLVFTDCNSVTDNQRIKMQTGERLWEWLMDYDGEVVTHWMPFYFELPNQ